MYLHYKIKNIIDQKVIEVPPNQPHVTQRPLPNHKPISLIDLEPFSFNPAKFIIPIGQTMTLVDILDSWMIWLIEDENIDLLQALEDEVDLFLLEEYDLGFESIH